MNDTTTPQKGRTLPPLWKLAPSVITYAVSAVIAIAAVVDIVSAIREEAWIGLVGVLLVVAGTIVGRWQPYGGLVLVATGPLVTALGDREPTAVWSMACFAALLFTLHGMRALVAGGTLAAANFAAVGLHAGTVDVSVDASASIAAFAALAAAAAGSAVRDNWRYRSEVEQRMRVAETTRIASVERGIAQERLRIARDLHDSVGHQIAVVNMRLGVAEVHLETDPSAVRDDLHSARDAVQSVLTEVQEILRILRVGDRGEQLEPTPGHELIRGMIDSYRTAGMNVEAQVDDFEKAVSPRVSVAAYRIVQESLTNAQRHGSGAVSVKVEQSGDGTVTVEVANLYTARTDAPGRIGNGLVGMRERAASVGGRLEIHADPPLFRTTAVLPARGKVEL
ncbi:sensor histidine kinase [Rhodococcus sp. NPDC003318]|uniref:sensor histidine kinase n=1 Tax=Rhodococcus sp. NPDC003318 TaxID=3364503 RepID=UPI0036AF3DA6